MHRWKTSLATVAVAAVVGAGTIAGAAERPRELIDVGPHGASATARAIRLSPPTPPPTPPPTGRFGTVSPGSPLPSDAACAAAVRPMAERQPKNDPYNVRRGVIGPGSAGPVAGQPITGNFTGTTEEIMQWVACKWGIDEDIIRAQIAKESGWQMSVVPGDNGESFGMGQVRVPYHPAAFVNDNAKLSSAYNLDYTYARWRSCFEGYETWLNQFERGAQYGPGDVWGCVGLWFTGRWRIAAADPYLAEVQRYLAEQVWTRSDFPNW